jgi:hypothetical protein
LFPEGGVSDDWVTIKEAAQLMRCNEKKLRQKEHGAFKYFPELARIQAGSCQPIFLFRSEILAWIERVERAAKEAALPAMTVSNGVSTYQPLKEKLERLGAKSLIRSLGIR